MSEPVSALAGAAYQGFAGIREAGPMGMITLRAKDLPGLAAAVQAAVGVGLPAPQRIESAGGRAVGWMSPDEYLLILPHPETGAALAALDAALAGQHYLATEVSDARAVFRITGEKAGQVLAKLCPVDIAGLAPGELRRTRVAQVAAAFWQEEGGYTLICFRSVAAYVMGLLAHAAQPGSELA